MTGNSLRLYILDCSPLKWHNISVFKKTNQTKLITGLICMVYLSHPPSPPDMLCHHILLPYTTITSLEHFPSHRIATGPTYSFRSAPTMILKNHSKKYISIQLTKPNQSNYCWAGCLASECLHIALQRLWLNMRYPDPISPTPHCRHCLQQQNTLDLTEFICPSFFSPYIYTCTLFAYLIFFAIQRIFSCFCCNFLLFFFVFLTLYVVVVQTNTHSIIIICCCCCCNCSLLNGLFVKWFYENFYPR